MDIATAVVLAHQGGWDELLWFAAPIVAVFAWVRWAERKARARALGAPGAGGGPGKATPGPTLPGHAPDPRKP